MTHRVYAAPGQAALASGLQNQIDAKTTKDAGRRAARDAAVLGQAYAPALPTVALTVSNAVAENGAGAAITFTATLSAASPTPVGLALTWGGTATRGVDYTAPAGPVIIPAGQTVATIVAAIVDDALVEGNETVQLTIAASTMGRALAATQGGALSRTATINDNES